MLPAMNARTNAPLRWLLLWLVAVLSLSSCAKLDDAPVCRPESRRCVGETAQFCDAEGHWSVPEICAAGTACIDGTCQAACGDACRPGQRRCSPEGVQVCEPGPAQCGQWGAPAPCALGERCTDGVCGADCPTRCEPGDRRCIGEGQFVECIVDAPCNAFGPPMGCGVSEEAGPLVCSGGQCGPSGSCADQCREGEWTCLTGAQAQQCVRGGEGCLDWSPPTDCAVGQICRGAVGCAAACESECDVGETRCLDGGVQTCVAAPSGCATWSAISPCAAGSQCQNGQCDLQCVPECAAGQVRCGPSGGVQGCDTSGPCPRFGAEVACAAGEQCAGAGVCGVCEPGATEARGCGNCGQQTRTCGEDRRWGEFNACSGEGVCTPGMEMACGRCGVQRCNDACQWDGCGGEGVCDPGATEPCGNCGTRACNGACQWDACGGQGVCAPGQRRDCNQCGEQGCTNRCRWETCNNGDGTEFRRCNECGWQFCCPNGDWCGCAPHYTCGRNQSCEGTGQCL
jgi:hypothetical protein